MKYLILAILLAACSTNPPNSERTMRNCRHTKDNYYICEEIPAHVQRDVPPERTTPHSNSYQH